MNTLKMTNLPIGGEFQAVTRQAGAELAGTLAGCNVNPAFRPHWTDLETGRHGIKWLIARILEEAGCIMPAVSFPDRRCDLTEEQANLRGEYLAKSLTSEQVIARVRGAYVPGELRYPDNTIVQYLSCIEHNKGAIESFRLFNKETKEAYGQGAKPRRYYLVKAVK